MQFIMYKGEFLSIKILSTVLYNNRDALYMEHWLCKM